VRQEEKRQEREPTRSRRCRGWSSASRSSAMHYYSRILYLKVVATPTSIRLSLESQVKRITQLPSSDKPSTPAAACASASSISCAVAVAASASVGAEERACPLTIIQWQAMLRGTYGCTQSVHCPLSSRGWVTR
jgi:hypothetical protein